MPAASGGAGGAGRRRSESGGLRGGAGAARGGRFARHGGARGGRDARGPVAGALGGLHRRQAAWAGVSTEVVRGGRRGQPTFWATQIGHVGRSLSSGGAHLYPF